MSTAIYERNKALEASNINIYWGFVQDENGEWYWKKRRPNGAIYSSSVNSYSNIADCIVDAQKNGYPTFEKASKNYPAGMKYVMEVEVSECGDFQFMGADFKVKNIAPIINKKVK